MARAMARGLDAEMRAWLHVPRGLGLPVWAQRELRHTFEADRESRVGRALGEVCFGIVDLETTGLGSSSHRILEIGLVVLRGGRVVERFATLIDVEVPIPAMIAELTGIDASVTRAAPTEAAAIARLAEILRREKVEVLVAHNAGFDRAFLERAWTRHLPSFELPPFLCSLRLARKWIRAPRYGLGALVEQLGIPPAERHRALGDALMTSFLWRELIERGRLRGVHSLEALAKLATPGRSPRRRRVRVVDGDRSIQ